MVVLQALQPQLTGLVRTYVDRLLGELDRPVKETFLRLGVVEGIT